MITDSRYVSRLTRKTLAVVLAGGRGSRLGVLTDWRTKPAVPFAGKFRIIDFTLSNCLNSGIHKVCVLTQYKSHSLIRHLMKGWSFLNTQQQDFLDLVPAQQWRDDDAWFEGTADAVYQSLDIMDGYEPEYVLILAGDHIYTMDYGDMLATHAKSHADFTIACKVVPIEEAPGFGVMTVDETGRIIGFEEKPENPTPLPDDPSMALASMGIYVSSYGYLRHQLVRDAANNKSRHDFGGDLIPSALKAGHRLQSHRFTNPVGGEAYWRDVGTIDSYFQANLEQASPTPPIDLYDPGWPIRTHHSQLPPAHMTGLDGPCNMSNALLSAGCVINSSTLEKTVLFSDVTVGSNSQLNGVLALPGCRIGSNVKLTNVILDNRCDVPDGTVIGEGPAQDAERYVTTEAGIVLVNRQMLGQGKQYMPGIKSRRLGF